MASVPVGSPDPTEIFGRSGDLADTRDFDIADCDLKGWLGVPPTPKQRGRRARYAVAAAITCPPISPSPFDGEGDQGGEVETNSCS